MQYSWVGCFLTAQGQTILVFYYSRQSPNSPIMVSLEDMLLESTGDPRMSELPAPARLELLLGSFEHRYVHLLPLASISSTLASLA